MGEWFSRRGFLGASAASIATIGGGYYVLGIGKGNGVKTPQCGTEPPTDLDAPTIGNADAPVTIASYSDFSCPHCRDHALIGIVESSYRPETSPVAKTDGNYLRITLSMRSRFGAITFVQDRFGTSITLSRYQ